MISYSCKCAARAPSPRRAYDENDAVVRAHHAAIRVRLDTLDFISRYCLSIAISAEVLSQLWDCLLLHSVTNEERALFCEWLARLATSSANPAVSSSTCLSHMNREAEGVKTSCCR